MFPVQKNVSKAPGCACADDASPVQTGPYAYSVSKPEGIEVRPERMLRIMGYREGAPVRPVVQRIAGAMAELAATAIKPVIHDCQVSIVRCDEAGLQLAGGTVFRGSVFAKHLAGCGYAIAFILTLGPRIDNIEKNLVAGGNLLEATFLETAGWVAVEEATRIYTEQLGARVVADGMELTRRLAPGYSFRVGNRKIDWPLEDQKLLFGLFSDVRLPVDLLESCAMMPKMSRTGVFGLRRRGDAVPRNPD